MDMQNPPRWLPEMDQPNRALVDYLMRRQLAVGGQVHLDCFLAGLMDVLDDFIADKDGISSFKRLVESAYNEKLNSIFSYMKENEAAIKLGAPGPPNGMPPGNPRLN